MLLPLQNNLVAAGGIELAVGLAEETSAAFALPLARVLQTGRADEADGAFGLVTAKSLAPPLIAEESDAAVAPPLALALAVQLATETDAATSLAVAGFFVRAVNELDVASPVSSFNAGTGTQAGGPGGVVYIPVPVRVPAPERPQPPPERRTARPQFVPVRLAEENDAALVVPLRGLVPLQVASEGSAARGGRLLHALPVALAVRTERAAAVTLTKALALQIAREARALAQPLPLRRALELEGGNTRERAATLRVVRRLALQNLSERTSARAPKLTKQISAAIARELTLARPIEMEDEET